MVVCGAALRACIAEGAPDEGDLFAARGVFTTLTAATPTTAAGRLGAAHALRDELASTGGAGSPLRHAVDLILLAMEKRSAPLFDVARREYAPALARDPDFAAMLDDIGGAFLSQAGGAPGGGLGGMLGQLLQGLAS